MGHSFWSSTVLGHLLQVNFQLKITASPFVDDISLQRGVCSANDFIDMIVGCLFNHDSHNPFKDGVFLPLVVLFYIPLLCKTSTSSKVTPSLIESDQ